MKKKVVIDIFNTDKKYNVIYADPPWRYGDRKCNGACEFHYNTMTLQEIKDLPEPGYVKKIVSFSYGLHIQC